MWSNGQHAESLRRERTQLLQELERVTARLSEIEIQEWSQTPPQQSRRMPVLDGPLEAGHYVKILSRDKYRGRVGKLAKRRGVAYWWIHLTKEDGSVERIYKTDAMLERLPFAEE